ncbi:helix-turn-helix transcriptional regulator [Actinoallomurus spadix]|uniref:Helix-turn-helix transcriptional regulator n=1 Tax=Actinoallomurus spadix TaxID=79912 RepID=A0ABN0VTQ8_9ACTN|nr:helix-turn-helix transcriptional regulator [Actinoallomurus spadix]MCO5987462.1 helix-turn-helix transcriptional regulator [Actinoallomurus spadix]
MVAQRDPYESPTIRAFAAELEAWRSEAGLSKVEFAETLGYTPQLISQLEAAKNIPSKKFAEDTDTFFKTKGVFVRLWKLVNDTRHLAALPPGFPEFVERETKADAIRVFGLLLVTGLLQTEEYAREILLTVQQPDVVDRFIASRMERQAILARDKPPRLWATFDERALRCMVGGPEIMRGQLEHLLEASKRPNIMIEVVPISAGAYAGLEGDVTLLSFDGRPDIAYTEAAGRGQVVEDPSGVTDFHVRYDLIRGHALPVAESRTLIESIMESL